MPPYTTPEIEAAHAAHAALRERLDHGLQKQIESAIQRGDSKEVRRLRDLAVDLAGELHRAEVALKEMEIAHCEAARRECGQQAKSLSDAHQAKEKERDAVAAEAERMAQDASRANEAGQSFERRLHRATQALAEAKEAETARLRRLAAQA